MKRIIVALATGLLLLSPTQALADEGHGASLDEVLESIYQEQGVESREDVNCNSLSEETLEELGDAVMSEMHPDTEVHERMDEMMGGEGSESLRLAHINMGRSYLGCNVGYGPGMMGGRGMGGMMGFNRSVDSENGSRTFGPMTGFNGMMGYRALPFFSGANVLAIISYVALIVFLGSGAYYFIKAASNSKKGK